MWGSFWRRIDWFAFLYVGGLFSIAALADHGMSTDSMALVAAVAWVIGPPLGYTAAVVNENHRKRDGDPRVG